jgi:putative Mn2+ efflux pump MntP
MTYSFAGEEFALLMMAFALGMDAFSVSLGMGTLPIRKRQIAKAGLTIGGFHVLMPLCGLIIGGLISEHFGEIAMVAGGAILVIIGGQMIISSLMAKEQEHIFKPVGIGLFIFALSVSLDSFSVGLSLGIFGTKGLFAILLFGMTAMILTWAGFFIGRKAHTLLGRSSEIMGGCILIGMGIKLLCTIL